MGEFTVKEKDVVVPGQQLGKGMDCLPSFGTYREGENVYASRLGLANINGKVVKIIPLTGVYMPKKGDSVIGQIVDVLVHGWRVDFGTAYTGMLSLKEGTTEFVARGADLTKYFNLGDYIMTNVINVTSQKLVDLSMKGPNLKKLSGGRIVRINPHKVPRVIGKRGSMVSMLKDATGCQVLVGKNGLIWISGEPESEVIAVKAIKMIENKSHISGLTEKIKIFLEEKTGKKIQETEKPDNNER